MVEGSHISLPSAYIRERTQYPPHPSKGTNWREMRQVVFPQPPPLGSQSKQKRCKRKRGVPESTCPGLERELRFRG